MLFTGLPSSGKSTIAGALHDRIRKSAERTVTWLDGDVVRQHLSSELGFSARDRDTNVRRVGWVAAEIAHHGGLVLVSQIAPFESTRRLVAADVAARGGDFVVVHVTASLAECERRDPKGNYARARAGEIADFTGISSPYEPPARPDLRVDTEGSDIPSAVDLVLELLRDRSHLATTDQDGATNP